MRIFNKIKTPLCFVFNIYLLSALIVVPKHSIAKESAPLQNGAYKTKVSSDYVMELKIREKQKSSKASNSNSLESNLVEISTQNLIDILDNKPTIRPSNIPIPKHKPKSLNNLEPAASNSPNERDGIETRLVSFAIKPEQISLDKNLENFLKKHAINLFNRDKNLKMKIIAYATEIEGEPHSDIRISLARALEVRSFLIKNNINPSRIKLSPEGKGDNNENGDRIDLIFIKNK